MNNNILLISFFSLLCSFAAFSQGGIDTNFGFNVQANVPVDLRTTIATDADTANVDFKYPTMRVRSDASNSIFEWTGVKWVQGGKSYSVANVAELSDLDCNTGNWAYVSDDDAWYYCDGTAWVEDVVAPSELAQEGASLGQVLRWDGSQYTPQTINAVEFNTVQDTVSVCNDTCQFLSLNQALEYASFKRLNSYDTIVGKKQVLITVTRNSDNSITVLENRIDIKSGDWSNVIITSESDSVVFKSTGSEPISRFMRFENCIPPIIRNFNIHRTGNTSIKEWLVDYNNCISVNISDLVATGFNRGFVSANSLSKVSGLDFSQPIGASSIGIILNGFSVAQISSTNVDGFNSGIYCGESNLVLINVNVSNHSADSNNQSGGVTCRNGVLSIFSGDFRSNGINESSNDIVLGAANSFVPSGSSGAVINVRGSSVQGGTNRIPNKPSDLGVIFWSERAYPFQESTTAAEPAASSGIRYYFNTDEQETKVSVNDQWQYLDTPDTLVVHLPVLEYTGNANDTIPNLYETYLTANPAGWGNRRVTAIEVTTPDTTSVDLHFWMYENDIVTGTSSLFLPDPGSSASYFTLPAGHTNRRFEVGDSFFPGGPVDISDSKMLDFRLLNGNGSAGIDDLVGEEPNGIYITLYLIE